MNEQIVYRSGEYLVIRSEALFCDGFNVYRREGEQAIKVNDRASFFTTLEDAKAFIKHCEA